MPRKNVNTKTTTSIKPYKGYIRSTKGRKNAFKYNITKAIFGGFPEKATTKIRYNETVSINPGVGAVTAYSFRANSVYDSNLTGTGHQGMGYDQWAAIYNHYIVIGSKIRATFHPVNAGTASTAFGIRLDDDGSSSSTLVTDYIESGKCKYAIQPDNYTIQHPKTLTHTFSAKKWFGVKDIADNKHDLGAQVNANPTDIAAYVLWVGPVDESSDLGAWQITVTIDYLVQFSEPKDQTRN